MRVTRAILGAIFVALAPACAVVWGFDEGTLAGGPGSSGAPLPTSSSGGIPDDGASSSGSSGEVDADTPIPSDCADRTPDLVGGRFVDGFGGADAEGCGSADAPCASIGRALLGMTAPSVVHVALGEYAENVVIPEALLGGGLRIEGRWKRSAAAWTTACDPSDEAATLVGVTGDEATLRVQNTLVDAGLDAAPAPDAGAAALTLRLIKVEGRQQASTGQSVYAVFVRNSSVELRDSTLVASRGGEGITGSKGSAGSGNACGTGEQGTAGGPLPAGVFGPDGFGASSAPPSPVAGPGQPGGCPSGNCRGGNGGNPGGNGGLGGASVALFLWGSTAAFVGNTGLNTIEGGAGGPGGLGGDGQLGADPGLGALCGPTKGGTGGAGGTGSPGAGGTTACVVRGGGSSIKDFTAGQCNLGTEGPAAPGGIPGEKKAIVDAP